MTQVNEITWRQLEGKADKIRHYIELDNSAILKHKEYLFDIPFNGLDNLDVDGKTVVHIGNEEYKELVAWIEKCNLTDFFESIVFIMTRIQLQCRFVINHRFQIDKVETDNLKNIEKDSVGLANILEKYSHKWGQAEINDADKHFEISSVTFKLLTGKSVKIDNWYVIDIIMNALIKEFGGVERYSNNQKEISETVIQKFEAVDFEGNIHRYCENLVNGLSQFMIKTKTHPPIEKGKMPNSLSNLIEDFLKKANFSIPKKTLDRNNVLNWYKASIQ